MSAIPAAVNALIDTITPIVQNVVDGWPGLWPDQDAVIIGWAAEGTGISIDTNPGGFGQPNREDFSITSVIFCPGGDPTVNPLRVRAFAYYTAICEQIRADKTLDGSVSDARPSTATVNQYTNESGGTVELTFTVACTAFV